MLILMGKTASGKDSVVKELVMRYGYTYLVPYTTRPPRKNEVKGKDYHFISERDFSKKVKHGFFIEWQSYDTAHGVWNYGVAAKDFYEASDKTVVILTPDGLADIIDLLYSDTVVYLDVSEKTIFSRLLLRGDDIDEARRRITADSHDFANAAKMADYIVRNEHSTIKDVAKQINRIMEGNV